MSEAAAAPGLEYPLLFGLPENKTEIFDGRMRVVWPFMDSEETGRAFDQWCARLESWRGSPRSAVPGARPKAVIGGVHITRYTRYVEMQVPIHVDTFFSLHAAFWRRELWDVPELPDEPGNYSLWRHGDVRMNLWRPFWEVEERAGWRQCCWGDVMLTDDTSLTVDLYWFSPEAPMELIGDAFAGGVPRAVAQVVSPATREDDHGPRLALLHRAGVGHVWLLDPALETLEAFAWEPAAYALERVYRKGDTFHPAFCPEASVAVEQLFRDQGWPRRAAGDEDEATEPWLIDPGRRLGLEYLMLLGHPARRYEIWQNSSPCVLAFGSAPEARLRLRHFLEDAARWAGVEMPRPLELEGDVEAARIGAFQFTRRRNRVHLDVAIDSGVYVRMLYPLADREVWAEFE